MVLDIITPAMGRPEILERTYKSFTEKLTGIEWGLCTCYINIDLFPCFSDELEKINALRVECVDVAKKYFGTVVPNLPVYQTNEMYHGHFTQAFNWLFKSATTEHILCLEDDWELLLPVDINELLDRFKKVDTLYQVVLRAYTYKYPCVCMSPGILHKRFYKAIAGRYDTLRNPECQIHSRTDLPIFIPNKDNCKESEKYVMAYPQCVNDPRMVIVKDIGRAWMEKSPYCRPQTLPDNDPRYKKKNNYTHWIKK